MTYVWGALAGVAFGGACGLIKYLILWRPMMTGKRKIDSKSIGIAQIVSMMINIVVLLTVYFVRNLLPFSFEACLIGAALALSLIGQLSPLRDVNKLNKLSQTQQNNEIKIPKEEKIDI